MLVHFILIIVSDAPPDYTAFFFLMIRRPPRSTLDRSSAASDVYKRQVTVNGHTVDKAASLAGVDLRGADLRGLDLAGIDPVSYTHLRAHETVLDLVCRLLLEKKKHTAQDYPQHLYYEERRNLKNISHQLKTTTLTKYISSHE